MGIGWWLHHCDMAKWQLCFPGSSSVHTVQLDWAIGHLHEVLKVKEKKQPCCFSPWEVSEQCPGTIVARTHCPHPLAWLCGSH